MNEAVSMKDVKKLRKAASLDMSNDPKDIERARARRTEIDFKDLMRQREEKKKKGLKEEKFQHLNTKTVGEDMKNFTSFMEASKTCPKGKYYCFTEKKCKPLPRGYRIGYGGRLAPDNRSDSGKMETLTDTLTGMGITGMVVEMVTVVMVAMVVATAVVEMVVNKNK